MQPLTELRLGTGMRILLAAVAGALIAIGYAPMDLWFGPLIGLPLLTWLVAGRRLREAALTGAVAGLVLNTITLHWVGVLGAWVAAALVLFMTLWLIGTALALSRVTGLSGWPLWAGAVWVAVEFISGRFPFGGFAWNRLAFTAVDQPLGGYFAWVGATGVTFLLVVVAHLILMAVLEADRRIPAAALAVGIVLVGGGLLLRPIAQPAEEVRVGVVQGNANRAEHGTPSYARSVTTNHLSETIFLLADERASDAPPMDFIVWPENSTDVDPISDVTTHNTVEHAVKLAGVPILVGAVMDGPDPATQRQTSSLWWDPATGAGDRYDKRNLVPFGEWIPFRDELLPVLPILEQVGRQSVPGTEPGVMDAPVARFPHLLVGTVICFELAWDETVYDTVRHGAQVIMTQSNTNTYAGTFEPHQQMAINRARSMELGRETIASTLNGLSGLIDARGRTHDVTAEFTAAHRVFDIPLRYGRTPAVVLNPWLGLALTFSALATVVLGSVRRKGDHRSANLEDQELPIGS